MKRWTRFGAALLLVLALGVLFAKVLTAYYQPMEERAYDLSLNWEGEAMPEGWVYDQKGWTVFTQEGEVVQELTPDGLGGFSGNLQPGQTFYFSRVIQEELDSPTLRLTPSEQTYAVFLDDTLLYTDSPEQGDQIGHLRLQALDWYRESEIVVPLPLDCTGRTLTIAQSTSPAFDGGYERVYPCAVSLYCGYAYESGLISESFQTAVPAALTYGVGLALLAMFLWQAYLGRLDLASLCGALASFSRMTVSVTETSFTHLYFDPTPIDIVMLSRALALLALLGMLLNKLSAWRRALLGVVTAGLGAVAATVFVLTARERTSVELVLWFYRLGTAALFLATALGFWEWKRRRWFYRFFCPLALAGTVLYVLPAAILHHKTFAMLLLPVTSVAMLAGFLSAVGEWAQGEIARRTEARLLMQRGELALRSYEALRRQREQVMMLHHDMVKHFRVLRHTTTDEKTAEYLDELLGEDQKIRPMVRSGNEMLDVILNGKLSDAADAGIAVEITGMRAPKTLPLTDAELCSLMMNLLDNAVEAASQPEVERPYIKLDLEVKGNFFVLNCENAATLAHIEKEAAPGHGLGLKIIQQISARHGDLMETEYGPGFYRVTLAMPLS